MKPLTEAAIPSGVRHPEGTTGRLFGVGTGPGDPELLTLKAVRVIEQADVVAWFAKAGNVSNARRVVAEQLRPGQPELALYYPVTTELPRHSSAYRDAITAFYDESAVRIAEHLERGEQVAVLSEGDPLFYGSWMHLHVRLAPRYATTVIPGVSGMSGGWSSAGLPICQGDDVLSILPGTLDEDGLVERLGRCEAAVIMKVGRNLPTIRRALARTGQLDRALYVERATMAGARSVALAERDDTPAPYFSIVLVPGWHESTYRPEALRHLLNEAPQDE
ncbi:precorrin-2 C(20)-methyltransferase [Kushneria phosphatilytica]|uniref:Precorrin-2 C(20)-methyltransferase n=1 Tax=Kushneria phosphatilytica TaxID=657387 RepID=A0A1S1NSI4_9GAMM|nr:precorrin-2 C(20)-methyltransferase [Kushneria phosphatilytica]OHV08438.1 precorrin-2 C(20)-methyltransferase [Kushneria phosphatilytica]QEL09866.1 precorrin-2 C(20)-methyltransferase [Kushneria phosphatilytica]